MKKKRHRTWLLGMTQSRRRKWLPRILRGVLVVVVVYFIVDAIWYRNVIGPAQWLDILAIVILVGVTSFYALETANIARRTSEQTKEIKRQTEQTLLPILVAICEIDYKSPSAYVRIRNIGLGPALDIGVTKIDRRSSEIRVAWAVGREIPIPIPLRNIWDIGELATGEKTVLIYKNIVFQVCEGEKFIIIMECNDTYGHLVGAFREFEVLKNQSGHLDIKEIKTGAAIDIESRIRKYPRDEVLF